MSINSVDHWDVTKKRKKVQEVAPDGLVLWPAPKRIRPEGPLIWYVIDRAIDELIDREDIIETTFREATLTYLIDQLYYSGLLAEKGLIHMPREKQIIVTKKPKRTYAREPYAQFKVLKAWKVIDQAIEDLVENQDMVETTVRKCIVGYILKRLSENKLLTELPKKEGACS
jgi:hypothetical protein